MARAVVAGSSDDELPDLNVLLSFPIAKGRREERLRSPRKQSSQAQQQSDQGSFSTEQRQKSLKESSVKLARAGRTARAQISKVIDRPSQTKPKSESTTYQLKDGNTKSPPRSILGDIPLLSLRR